MSEMLGLVIALNLALAAASLLVLALRPVVRRGFGAQAAYLLWLALPVAAIAVLLPARSAEAPILAPAVRALVLAAAPVAPPSSNPAATLAAGLDLAPAITATWLMGAALAFALLMLRQARFLQRLGHPEASDHDGRTLVAERSDVGPAVIGLMRPRIVLPSDFDTRFAPAEQQLMLAHEQVHLARGDIVINAALATVQCLFWFNLPLHIAARLFRIDQELACDATVLRRFPKRRRLYAEALLKAQLAPLGLPIGCYWPAGSEGPLQLRIALVSGAPRSRLRRAAGAGLAAIAIALAGVGAWAAQPPRPAQTAKPVGASYRHNGHDERRLFEASATGDLATMRALLTDHIDPNVYVFGDGTPLIVAARSGGLDAVRLLLDHGADPNRPVLGDGNPLIAASMVGDRAVVRELLTRGARVDDNVPADETALITAARTGQLGVVEELVVAGANVNLKVAVWQANGLTRSPLGEAVRTGHADVAAYLRAHGASP